MTATTGVHGKRAGNPLALAIQAEREGVAFFEKAQSMATDPKVKELLGKLVTTKKEHLRSFEESLKEARIIPPNDTGRKAEIYPLKELQKTECYVCGHSIELEAVPESCPRCGASRYTFEKDITLRKVWEFAESGMITTLDILSKVQSEADEQMKRVLSRQIKIEQNLLSEMHREREGLKGK